jgi:hypothetical protein
MPRAAVAAVTAALAACGPEITASKTALLFAYDAAAHRYGVESEELPTLTDPRRVEGAAAKFTGAATLTFGIECLQLGQTSDADALSRCFRAEGGGPVKPNFRVEAGVIVPEDFHTLGLFTVYRNLESARAFFIAAGFPEERAIPMQVFYDPTIAAPLVAPTTLSDNAAYSPVLDGFLVLPSLRINAVPLAFNRGVMTHEYSHFVFNRLVHGGAKVPRYAAEGWPAPAANSIRALDEGLADVFGATHADDPDFIAPSTSGALVLDRDLSRERVFDAELGATLGDDALSFDPYALGSVAASLFWAVGETRGRAHVAELVVRAEVALKDVLAESFRVTRFLDLVALAGDDDDRAAVCAEVERRFGAVKREVPSCP